MNTTSFIDLPSKGLIYESTNPLSKGTIELKQMTSNEEDIIINRSYLEKGIMFDKLILSLLVDKSINIDSLIDGDYQKILYAIRINGHGPEYSFDYEHPITKKIENYTINLIEELSDKFIDETLLEQKYKNEFKFTLPISKIPITFKILNKKDIKDINTDNDNLISKTGQSKVLTLGYAKKILSVNGDTDLVKINELSNNMNLRDAKAFRDYYIKVEPSIIDSINIKENGNTIISNYKIPFNISFFFP